MKMKRTLAMAMAVAMMASLAACGGNAGGTEGKKAESGEGGKAATGYAGTMDENTVVVDLRAEPVDMNSFLTTDVAAGDILRMTMASLYKLDENDQPVEDLAEDTQVSEDGKVYTMKIRQDAKWTNGDPVTAKDFVYAYQMMCTESTAAPYSYMIYENLVNGVEVFNGTKPVSELGVKALDDYTLEVSFVNPIPYAKHLFSFTTFYPMNQKAYEEIGADNYAKDADKIVTNGAYTLSEWVHDDHITLTKNPDYYNAGEIEIENVKYLMLKDTNARMNAFKAGEVDSIDLVGDQVQQAKDAGMNVQTFIDNGNWYLQYNVEKKELSNAKIRKALGMAIDVQSLCDNVLKDGSVPATCVTPTSINGAGGKSFAEAVGTITVFDAEEAKKLFEEGLKELGITADQFKVSLVVDDTTNAQKNGTFFQDQWKQALGIDVEVKPMPFKARIQAMQNAEFDIVYAGWAPDYNDPMTYLELFMTGNGNNYGKFSNKEYDTLLTDAKSEADVNKRQDLLIQAEKLICEKEAPIYPLYFSKKPYVVSDKVTGITRTGFQEWDFQDGAKLTK